jgi:putative acetyltransferase
MLDSHHIEVRREQTGDEAAIRDLLAAAFGQPDESRIVDAIRRAGHPAISLVAVDGSRIVGHILFTPVAIDSPGTPIPAFGLAPMAVLPERQRQGIGSQLVVAGLRECADAGCEVVVVVGHPQFYPRFGFRRGSLYGLRSEFDVPDDVFMVAELTRAPLAGRAGLVRYLPEFSGSERS